ncbi:hypothetical protein Hanom_Chr16g01468941 [Helianthus anomalus]
MASVISETTSQHGSERRSRMFSEMQKDDKVDFLFSQLQAAAGQINRQSEFMKTTRSDLIKQKLEMNTLKSIVQRQQAEIEQLKVENVLIKVADEKETKHQLQQM